MGASSNDCWGEVRRFIAGQAGAARGHTVAAGRLTPQSTPAVVVVVGVARSDFSGTIVDKTGWQEGPAREGLRLRCQPPALPTKRSNHRRR
jgi:hypothetical protein